MRGRHTLCERAKTRRCLTRSGAAGDGAGGDWMVAAGAVPLREPPPRREGARMRIDRKLVVLVAVLLAAPSVYAAPCTVTSTFPRVMQVVEQAVPCASATTFKRYKKQAKQAVGGLLSKSCKKLFVKRFINQSTCGRPNFEVCCDTNKKGKDTSKVVRKGRCKGQVCAAAPTSVGEGCMANGQCVPTTTTTTSTTTTTTRASTTSTVASSTSTTTTSTSTTIPPGCGDGVIGVGEECDGGDFGTFVCPAPG